MHHQSSQQELPCANPARHVDRNVVRDIAQSHFAVHDDVATSASCEKEAHCQSGESSRVVSEADARKESRRRHESKKELEDAIAERNGAIARGRRLHNDARRLEAENLAL